MKFGGLLIFCWFILFFSQESLAQGSRYITFPFSNENVPARPDFSDDKFWAALPWIDDLADRVPKGSGLTDNQDKAEADVFFLYPTIYTGPVDGSCCWNASLADEELNKAVDESTILNQSTVFNGSCRVFAPRYRQAHYSAFVSSDTASSRKALNLAYEDVKAAFEHYLSYYHEGRPIIIAGHSQGTVHAKRLLKEFFDGKDLQKYLVEAYLIGIATPENEFKNIKPSNDAASVGGFVSWNTFLKGFYPPYYENGLSKAVSTNPLSWKIDENYQDRFENSGSVGLKFKFYTNAVDALNKDGLLWIDRPHVPGRAFLRMKVWHKADYNLYWMNIRENVALRLSTYFENPMTR